MSDNHPQQPEQPEPYYPNPQQPVQPYGQAPRQPVQPYGHPPQQPVQPYSYQPPPVPPYRNDVRQARDRAQYVRTQTGHSVTKHILLAMVTVGISLIWTTYYAFSPNHYFHA